MTATTTNAQNRSDRIIAFEAGELDAPETLDLFAHLVQSGLAWELQGSYGRAASKLLELGLIDAKGNWYEDELAKIQR